MRAENWILNSFEYCLVSKATMHIIEIMIEVRADNVELYGQHRAQCEYMEFLHAFTRCS